MRSNFINPPFIKLRGGGRDFVNIENCLELARHKIDAMMYFELRMKNIIH